MTLQRMIDSRTREISLLLPVVGGEGDEVLVRTLLWEEKPKGGMVPLFEDVQVARDSDPKHECERWQSALKHVGLEMWSGLARAGIGINMPMIGSMVTLDRLIEDFSAIVMMTDMRIVVVALLPEKLLGHEGCTYCAAKFAASAN